MVAIEASETNECEALHREFNEQAQQFAAVIESLNRRLSEMEARLLNAIDDLSSRLDRHIADTAAHHD